MVWQACKQTRLRRWAKPKRTRCLLQGGQFVRSIGQACPSARRSFPAFLLSSSLFQVFSSFVQTHYYCAVRSATKKRRRRPGADQKRFPAAYLVRISWPVVLRVVSDLSPCVPGRQQCGRPRGGSPTSSPTRCLTHRGDKAWPSNLRRPQAGWPDSLKHTSILLTALLVSASGYA